MLKGLANADSPFYFKHYLMKGGSTQMKELESVKNFRSIFRERDYRLLVARIVAHYLKEKVGSKNDLQEKVNKVLI